MFPPTKNQAFDQNMHVNYSIPPISEDYLKLWLQNTSSSTDLSNEDDHFSNFRSEKSIPSENLSLENTFIMHGSENATSSNIQSSNNSQTRKYYGAGGKEGTKGGEECKRHKRPRSTHNLNERIRRKKLTEKMMALQEMIPNSIKKDQASTLDDAIKYIKTLQCLVQMQMEAGHTPFHSHGALMLPLEGQHGFPILNLTPISQTGLISNGLCTGMSIGYPVGLHNPWLFRSSATSSGLQSVQNNCGQFPMYADSSISYFGISQQSSDTKGKASPSQGAIS